MKLTAKQLYCLRELRDGGDGTGCQISIEAKRRGQNGIWRPFEWADAPLRELRGRGLVEYTGQKERARHIHRITGAGRAALAEIEGKA